ncbi:unnamed protein product [Parnassius apollo]|uniref:(apollo) hypothetical protein n=1 Tax=Parnassius apollo TaxID=110799 RepID=A0A8S3Y6X4_PARAO|nr:unnamed protein product [Parnassius apollo]
MQFTTPSSRNPKNKEIFLPSQYVVLSKEARPKQPYIDEIVKALQAEKDSGDIILFPPNDGEITDEDSGDENEANIHHLSNRMLRSQVESQNRNSVSGENLDEEEKESMPARKKPKKK